MPEFIEALTGIDIPDRYDTMITVVVTAVCLWGILSLIERVNKKKSSVATEKAYTQVTNVAGDLIQIDGEQVRAAVQERLSGKRRKGTIKSARDFVFPAKKHKARAIRTGTDVEIGQDIIEEFPSELDEQLFEPNREEYDLDSVSVSLRAHDLDRAKAGWAGVVADVSENRVKIQIDPSISSKKLFTKSEVKADIRGYTSENADGDMHPYLYVIQKIHE